MLITVDNLQLIIIKKDQSNVTISISKGGVSYKANATLDKYVTLNHRWVPSDEF